MDAVVMMIEKLTCQIQFEGCYFDLQIIQDVTELRLSYCLSSVDESSKHYPCYLKDKMWVNPFTNTYSDYLYLYEGITNESELRDAVQKCCDWVTANIATLQLPVSYTEIK